jgi:membrane-bound lytic murein transglycosylase MltF
MKLFLDMNERFPPVHLVTLDCLLDLETDLNRIYPTSMSEAARIRTIQTGIIAQYTISEREEIARIVKMNPDLACSITRAKNVADFVEQVKNAYEKIR